MIVWLDGAHDPTENMRRDLALLESRETPGAEAVLRLFQFDPPGITLGRSQSPERTLDLERCRRDGVPWAVRPTGGRAIFHAEEWTYSLAARIEDREWGGGLSIAYERAARLVLESLIRLHVPVVLARRGGAGGTGAPVRAVSSPACFASAARHEILLGGRKLVGSAQRRTATALLQQGSVLVGPGHLRLADYVAGAPDRGALRASLEATAADASQALGSDRRLERWAAAIAACLPVEILRTQGATVLTLSEAAPYTRYTRSRLTTGSDVLHGG